MGRSTNRSGRNSKKSAASDSTNMGLDERIMLGVSAAEKGDRAEAHRIFDETVKLHPDAADAWVWLGGTSSRLEEAEHAFERAYEIDPNNERASLGLRWARLRRQAIAASVASEAAADNSAVPAAIEGAAVPAPDMPSIEGERHEAAQEIAAQVHEPSTPEPPAVTEVLTDEAVTDVGPSADVTPATSVPAVPEAPAEAATPEWSVWTAAQGTPGEQKPTETGRGSNTLMITALAAAILVLVVLAYWFFFMPH